MDFNFLTCPICYEEFNLTKYLPRILPGCAHTICSECLAKVLQNQNKNQRICPFDKQSFPAEMTSVNEFKANFLAKEMLERQSQKELCTEHNEEMSIFCFTDQKKICGTCVCEGPHQNHKIRTMKAIKSEANRQAKKIKDALDNIDNCYSKGIQTLAETKALLLERVTNEFQTIKKAITDKEKDIVYQIQSYFYIQEQKIDNLIGNSSNTRKNIHNHANTLENILTNEELLKNGELFQKIPDHLSNCKNNVDFQLIEEEGEVIRSKIEDLLQSFQEFLQGSVTHVWSELKLDLKPNLFNRLAFGILKDLPVQSNNSSGEMEVETDPFILKVSTSFNFKYDEGELTISTTQSCKENTLNIEKWQNGNNVSLILNHKIAEGDLEVLALILRKIKTNGSLYLGFYENGFSQKILEFLAQTTLPFSRVDIYLEKLDLTAERVSDLLGKMLSQFNNLEDITVFLEEAKLSKNALKEFLGDVFTNGTNIKSIYLDLSTTNINDDDICQFSLNLPTIKHFELFLNTTNVTNCTIEWLKKNLFKPMSSLECFRLYLNETLITDAYMEDLLLEFNNIKRLTLDFGLTKITDKTLEALSQTMPTFVNSLQEFVIGLHNTDVTDEGVSLILMSFPNVTKLTMDLSQTKVTDKTVELLAQKTLSSTFKLDRFTLLLSCLTVTDSSMIQIFETLPNLDELNIQLNSTRVTDISVAPFIIDKVPAMEELSKFQLDISDTNVSSEVQAKAQELENAINSGE